MRDGGVIAVGHLNLDPSAYQTERDAYLSDASPLRSKLVSVNGGLCNVILKINDKALNLELTKGMSVAQVLADHKITLNDSDFINVSESDMIYDGMNIVVKKSISVTVEADGKKAYISLFGGTVQDALRAAGIEVNKDDLVNQPLKMTLQRI